MQRQPPAPTNGPAVDDEEEYEPDFEPEDAEQVVNRLDGLPPSDFAPVPAGPLAPFKLPEGPPLTLVDAQRLGDMAVRRTFGMLTEVDEKGKGAKGGFNRLAASDYGRDAWVTILSRLATRASAGLDVPDDGIKDEFASNDIKGNLAISEAIRDRLYGYVMNDWKKRIDVAVSWLNEEWYNDKILAPNSKMAAKANVNGAAASSAEHREGNYRRCALRLIDGILPFVEHTDKDLIRFISELPALDYDMLLRMKKMAEDPERIDLACRVLVYLHMFRPPVRTTVVDIMAELWRDNDRAKPKAGKWLIKWKPEALQEEAVANGGEVKREGESAHGSLEVRAKA